MRSDHGSPGGAGHGAGRIARLAAAISSVDSAGTLRGHARSEDAADHRSQIEMDGRGEAASGAVDVFQSHRRDAEAALDQKVRRLQAVCSATVSELPRQESRRQARLHPVSAETKEIKARHLGEANARKREGIKYTRTQKRLDDREFSKSCRLDKRKFVAGLAKQAEDANKRGDYAEITRWPASRRRNAARPGSCQKTALITSATSLQGRCWRGADSTRNSIGRGPQGRTIEYGLPWGETQT
eukprot:SAG11_NODE_6890_length_1230_cov_22.609195_2_plen_241_part_01